MELLNSTIRIEEITTTLQRIKEVNQMLSFHQTFIEPDQNAIDNFQVLREDFMAQLSELMDDFNVEVKWKEAA